MLQIDGDWRDILVVARRAIAAVQHHSRSSRDPGDRPQKKLEDRKPMAVATSPFNDINARFSSDGKWFSCSLNESGWYEISVRPFEPGAPGGTPAAAGGR